MQLSETVYNHVTNLIARPPRNVTHFSQNGGCVMRPPCDGFTPLSLPRDRYVMMMITWPRSGDTVVTVKDQRALRVLLNKEDSQ